VTLKCKLILRHLAVKFMGPNVLCHIMCLQEGTEFLKMSLI